MRPVRTASFAVLVAVAACSAPPIAGRYEGPDRPPDNAAAASAGRWIPAQLELLADGSCTWRPAIEVKDLTGVFTPFGTWNVDASRSGHDVVVVHPDRQHPDRSLTFDVA